MLEVLESVGGSPRLLALEAPSSGDAAGSSEGGVKAALAVSALMPGCSSISHLLEIPLLSLLRRKTLFSQDGDGGSCPTPREILRGSHFSLKFLYLLWLNPFFPPQSHLLRLPVSFCTCHPHRVSPSSFIPHSK